MSSHSDDERLRRWRLVLGGADADGTGVQLQGDAADMDACLDTLYGDSGEKKPGQRRGSRGRGGAKVTRWLGDIRRFFPHSVIRVMQQDAIDRLDLRQLLTQPEVLEHVVPDIQLVATLLSLKGAIPAETRDTARRVVQTLVDELMRRLEGPTLQSIRGALDRSSRTNRPRYNEVDWRRTIRANLGTWQPESQSIIVEKAIGYGRRRSGLRHVVLAVDQSGSMARSLVYASIFGAVLASMPAVSLRMCVFDTEVADLSEHLDDPVELLFAAQLGGGTDIERAVGWVQGQVTRPRDTIVVLVTDLFEGGDRDRLVIRLRELVAAEVQVVVLLALDDEGAPYHDRDLAETVAALGIPAFACTPDRFPEMMAAAIDRRDLTQWHHEAIKASE